MVLPLNVPTSPPCPLCCTPASSGSADPLPVRKRTWSTDRSWPAPLCGPDPCLKVSILPLEYLLLHCSIPCKSSGTGSIHGSSVALYWLHFTRLNPHAQKQESINEASPSDFNRHGGARRLFKRRFGARWSG